ncbi:uncharacterized protein O3C94_005321 isoform 2-T2 [Discoglossus pictus]
MPANRMIGEKVMKHGGAGAPARKKAIDYKAQRQRGHTRRGNGGQKSVQYDPAGRMSASHEEKQRGLRFSEEENEALVSTILNRYNKLFIYSAGKGSALQKRKLWREVQDAVNRISKRSRSMEVIKKRFQDCKRFVKFKMIREAQLSTATGEGSQPIQYSHWEALLKEHASMVPMSGMERFADAQIHSNRQPRASPEVPEFSAIAVSPEVAFSSGQFLLSDASLDEPLVENGVKVKNTDEDLFLYSVTEIPPLAGPENYMTSTSSAALDFLPLTEDYSEIEQRFPRTQHIFNHTTTVLQNNRYMEHSSTERALSGGPELSEVNECPAVNDSVEKVLPSDRTANEHLMMEGVVKAEDTDEDYVLYPVTVTPLLPGSEDCRSTASTSAPDSLPSPLNESPMEQQFLRTQQIFSHTSKIMQRNRNRHLRSIERSIRCGNIQQQDFFTEMLGKQDNVMSVLFQMQAEQRTLHQETTAALLQMQAQQRAHEQHMLLEQRAHNSEIAGMLRELVTNTCQFYQQLLVTRDTPELQQAPATDAKASSEESGLPRQRCRLKRTGKMAKK